MLAAAGGLPWAGKEVEAQMRDTLLKLAAGAVGGVVGTLFMMKASEHAGKLPESMRPPAPNEDPGEFMVRQGERVVGPLRQKVHTRAAHSLHWLYGLTWPLVLAGAADAVGLRSTGKLIAAGALVGAAVWAVGYVGWMPAAGLVPPVHRVPLARSASGLASHVAYGTVAALPLALTAPRLPS